MMGGRIMADGQTRWQDHGRLSYLAMKGDGRVMKKGSERFGNPELGILAYSCELENDAPIASRPPNYLTPFSLSSSFCHPFPSPRHTPVIRPTIILPPIILPYPSVLPSFRPSIILPFLSFPSPRHTPVIRPTIILPPIILPHSSFVP
jgi:hypothetical protein